MSYSELDQDHSQSSVTVCRPSLQLGTDIVTAQDDIRLLGVTISSDLSLQRHVSNVSATAFYWLCQLRRVRRSLDSESVATFVHAFMSSRVDQCNALLAGATKSVTDTLQRVMNAAARVVGDTRKFDRGLTQILTLGRCGRSSNIQTRCHQAQMSAWQGSTVPCRLLHTGHQCCRQAASQVSHTATDGGAKTSAIHCWMLSICCARPQGLELLAGRLPRTAGL